MSTIVFLLEEESAQELLQVIVPQMVRPEVTVRYITFEGKVMHFFDPESEKNLLC